MNERYLNPHKINKTIFESDKKFSNEYDTLIQSNKPLKKKFDRLEEKLSQGHFNIGQKKGFQRWKKTKNIYYVGSQGGGARIYFRFVPDKYEIEILAYSNKHLQTEITTRMENLYDN